jgi:hypothetical protein
MVGEQGPEMVNMGAGNRVFSNRETMGMFSGGGMSDAQVRRLESAILTNGINYNALSRAVVSALMTSGVVG